MKKTNIIIFLFMLSAAAATAQINDMPLRVYVPDNGTLPVETQQVLQDKLLYWVSGSSVTAEEQGVTRFYVTARPIIESKDVTSTTPVMHVVNMDVTLYIADLFDGKIFSRVSLKAKGAGPSEERACMSAFKHIRLNDETTGKFVADARQGIIDYYKTQGAAIFQEAATAAAQHEYERALFLLTAIPSFVPELYTQAQQKIPEIYQQYVNYDCKRKLAEARQIWNATQNRDGAEEAGALLAEIDPEASCYPQVESLSNEIRARIGEEWTIVKKVYDDSVSLEKRRITAAQKIGVAWGNGQKPNTTNIIW